MGRENRVGVFELLQNPKLADLFKAAMRQLAIDLRSHTVCTVESYNATTQRVDVKVDMLSRIVDTTVTPSPSNPNPTVLEQPKKLKDIPVAWPRTSTGYLTFPLNVGDRGELHIQDRSLDGYLVAGQTAEPARRWTHNLADATFEPCIYHNADPILPPTDLTATVLHGNTFIKLGRLATSFILKGTQVHAAFTTWTAAIATAGTTWALVVPPTPVSNGAFIGAVITATAILQGTLGTWLSTKVQTE